ncbi:MAG: phosphomannomutase [Natronomonas sp.]
MSELFGTAGIRGDVRSTVTPTLATAVGRAAAEDGTEFVVGRDGRVTGPGLAAAVAAGLESGGADVVRLGRVPTPALAYASVGRHGIMVTASHNPPGDNGLKLFADGTEYDTAAEEMIERRIDDGLDPVAFGEWGKEEQSDVRAAYRRAVVTYVREQVGDCAGVAVALDTGNGVGGLIAPTVLGDLGADVTTLNGTVDGHFPGRESKPTPESLTDLRAFVAGTADEPGGDYDLGIALDGDADRVVVVDGDGDVVHEDTVLAIVAEYLVRDSTAEDPVVITTPNASARVDERVRAAGGRTERVGLGTIHEGLDTDGDVVFAAEPWKHMYPAFGTWIDGIVAAAVVTALVERDGLDSLREPVRERPYRKVNVDCQDEHKSAAMDRLSGTLPEQFPEATLDTDHGIRLTFEDASWILIRPSGTEPYLRIYAESDAVDSLTRTAVDAADAAVEWATDGSAGTEESR